MRKGKRVVNFTDVHVGYTPKDLSGVEGTEGYGGRGVGVEGICYLPTNIDNDQVDAICSAHHLLSRHGLGAEKLVFGEYGDQINKVLSQHGVNGSAVINPFFIGNNSMNCFPEEWFGKKIPLIEDSILANSKINLREKMKKHIPFNLIVSKGDNYLKAVQRVMKESPTGKVIVKEDGKASGDGMTSFRDVAAAAFEIQSILDFPREVPVYELIVEVEHDKKYDGSIQVGIPEDPNEPIQYLGVTRQFVKGKNHEGNSMSSEKEIPYFDINLYVIFLAFQEYLEEIRKLRCYGFGTLDFIITDSNEIFVVEFNRRMTASYFLWELKKQLIKNWGAEKEFGICLFHCNTPHLESWDDIVREIDGEMFNGDRGIIPLMPILGVKTGIVSIQPTIEEAEKHCFEMKNKLEMRS